MALLVVRLLGWAIHLETGRDPGDEPDDDTDDHEPVVTGGHLESADGCDPRVGFVLPANDWRVE